MNTRYYHILDNAFNYDPANKRENENQFITYMLNRTQSMFKWSGLPDTIPERILELFLQIEGHCCFYQYEDSLYVFFGGLGGKPDVYYMPTIYTIANPALGISKNLKIDDECIVMSNDSMYRGLMPLFTRYAAAMTETELSISIATKNSRIISLISAPDDRTKSSAEHYLDQVDKGRLGVIAENAFLEGIKTQPYGSAANTNVITNLIELMQYQKASWFNELGLNANYNMKRESLNSEESQLNNDALLPLVDDMLKCRRKAAEKVNEMFGTDISVDLASSWEDNEIEIAIEHGEIEEPIEDPEEGPAEDPEEGSAEEPEEPIEDEIDDIKEGNEEIKEILEGVEDE